MPVNGKKEDQLAYAEDVYNELKKAGVDALLDDRPERAGVKFKDCDLIGYPLRITVSPKGMEAGTVEIKVRRTGEVQVVPREACLQTVQSLLTTL